MVRSESPRISVSRRGSTTGEADCTVVWIRGEHDIATKVSLARAIARAAQRDEHLLVDLSNVTFMDASTLGVIVSSWNRLRSRGQSLEVRAPSPAARRLIELCDLGHLVQTSVGRGVHPVGVAAALSTWVDVPSSPLVGAGDQAVTPAAGRSVARQRDLVAADARTEEAAGDVEVDRGGP